MMIRRAAVLAIAAACAGCLQRTGFHCQSDGQCFLGNNKGVCESTTYCSFVDPSCGTGRRYGEFADTLSQACVAAVDGGTDGGVNGQCSLCVNPNGPYNYAFVTSKTYTPGTKYTPSSPGTFASLDDADSICNDLAKASKVLPHDRHYKAWLSDSQHDARDRLVVPGTTPPTYAQGWIRPDGKPFADSIPTLATGTIFYPLRIDENKRDVIEDFASGALGTVPVATGTGADGKSTNVAPVWTSTSANYQIGDALETTVFWTGPEQNKDARAPRLYCFGVDQANPLQISPQPGRRAFLSGGGQRPFVLPSNRANADTQCTDEANHHNLPGKFFALLSLQGEPATKRFPPGTPWVRIDGVPWINQVDDLAAGTVLTALNTAFSVDVSGTVYTDYRHVWTGSTTPGVAADATSNCTDWTSANASESAVYGRAVAANPYVFDEPLDYRCNSPYTFLYCLQQADQ